MIRQVFVFVCIFGTTFSFLTDGTSQASINTQHNLYSDVIALILDEKTNRHQLEWELGQLKTIQKATEDECKNNTDILQRTIQNLKQEKIALQQKTNSLQQTVSTLTQEANTMEQTISSMKQTINTISQANTLKDKTIQALNQSVLIYSYGNQRLKQNVNSLLADKSVLQSDVAKIKRDIANGTDHTMVTFSGQRGRSGTVSNQPIKFTSDMTSYGGGYNTSDGIFYCPVQGWYIFDVTIMGYATSNAAAYLTKNNNDVMYIYSGQSYSSYYPSGSRSITLHLNVGDKVWVKGTGSKYYNYCSLSITLISKS